MAKHAVIYVFGLGDHRSRGQQFVISLWKVYGLDPYVYRMQWREPGSLEGKLAGLLQHIDSLADRGYTVSLVGTSAGASAVMNVYAQRQATIHRVVCICGKLRHAETIHPGTYHKNPAFKESLNYLPHCLDRLRPAERQRIVSIRPLKDGIVPPDDTVIPGAQSRIVPTIGHVFSIACTITLFSPMVVRFIKRA